MSVAALLLFPTACSVVFTAGISGQVVDAEEFADNPGAGGINGVRVYLYMREGARTNDRERFEEEGLLPDEDDGDGFYLRAVTDTVGGSPGAFSFPTIYWNDLLPRYGRSGDRRDLYLLLYHPRYGLVDHTATIVSDTTNTLAPVEITSLFVEATIEGRVERDGSTTGVAGVSVSAYIAEAWSGDFTYATEPEFETTTGPAGQYSLDIRYPRALVESEAGGGGALLTFDADDYLVSAAVDPDLTTDFDADGDGTFDVTLETPTLPAGETTELADVSIKQISFTEVLNGRVGLDNDGSGDGNIDVGTNGATVSIYIDRAAPPGALDPPDLVTTTSNRIVDLEFEAGWFSFNDISWDDDAYPGSQSSITCYIDVDTDGDGTPEVDNQPVTIYSNTSNTVQVVL
jgi:hypothetical protein